MKRGGWITSLMGALLLVSCSGADETSVMTPPPGIGATSNGGSFFAVWRPLAGEVPLADVPLNEEFDAEVWLFEDESCQTPIEGAEVALDCRMPAHRHGMLGEVELVDRGAGRYSARGLLCHMPGHWELYLDLTRGAVTERAQFDIELR